MSAPQRLSRAELASLCGCKVSEIPNQPLFNMVKYMPPGPVGAAYVRSTGPIDCITGPAGSGKTVASVFKVIRFTVAAMPVGLDGVVRVRGTVLRDNYRALYRTTLRSWFEFIPPDWSGSVFTGGQDRPAQHVLKLATVREVNGVMREVPVELTVDFFAVGDTAIEELLKGYETSWVWCNEGDLLHARVIPFAFSRTGRYPPNSTLPAGAKKPRMVAVDFNPTPPNHPLWKACNRGSFQEPGIGHNGGPVLEEDKPASTLNFFHQPSGLSPDAENRVGKSFDAYQEEANTLPEEEVRRFVHGLPGYAHDGKPIYAREFNRHKHIAGGTIPVLPGIPLDMGFDQGLTPAAIFSQTSPLGQKRILAEVYIGHGVGPERFIRALMPLLVGRFAGLRLGRLSGDPAGFVGADKVNNELTWAQSISAGLGAAMYPAPTNDPTARWQGVKYLLTHDIDVTMPAILIDPSCEWLIEGFEAEYKFPKFKMGAPMQFGNDAVKNEHSNVHDALQYDVLGTRGLAGVIEDAARAGRPQGRRSRDQDEPAGRPGDFSVWDVC